MYDVLEVLKCIGPECLVGSKIFVFVLGLYGNSYIFRGSNRDPGVVSYRFKSY
jgi:hypothetical protein